MDERAKILNSIIKNFLARKNFYYSLGCNFFEKLIDFTLGTSMSRRWVLFFDIDKRSLIIHNIFEQILCINKFLSDLDIVEMKTKSFNCNAGYLFS